MLLNYKQIIEDNFSIVNKDKEYVPFLLNPIQEQYVTHDFKGNDIVLKARQQGFSSLITAIFTADFLFVPNTYSVIVADVEDNAATLLSKVKMYLQSYEAKHKVKIPLKYNSKFELRNEFMQTTFVVGTAKSTEFGRSKTIHNLHLSELAFYPNIANMIAGAAQAVPEGGKKIFETTANGFNEFKTFYEDAVNGDNGYNACFYKASAFYSPSFLAAKRVELGRKFPQEYPETDEEAFLSSGDCYFNVDMLKVYYENLKIPMTSRLVYPRTVM